MKLLDSILTLDVLVMVRRGVVRVVVEVVVEEEEEEDVDGYTLIETNLSVPAEIVKREDARGEEEMEKEMEENVSETFDERIKTEEESTEARYFSV